MTDDRNEYVRRAIDEASSDLEPPKSIDEYVESVLSNPTYACSSAEYLLNAIEYYGTRTVTEYGEEHDRYVFFDDPENNGEHAILGHTRVLNEFVEDLRQQAYGTANEEKVFWFIGPTATGKSELKRCIINGLEAYSQTDEGKRYTVEWNVRNRSDDGPRYTDGVGYESDDDADWFQSPIQANPLTVLPEDVRRDVLDEAGVANPDEYGEVGMDPFSAEAIDILESEYDHDPDRYDDIMSDDHVRVVRYTMEPGRGIGVLQAEDAGKTNHRLVGQWMPGMVKELDSRGQRNPQAFAYDGIVSQGNAGISIVEDASKHTDMLYEMLNVVDDDVVKIDRRTQMEIDTVFLLISNPDLRRLLIEDESTRALRRRLVEYSLPYLMSLSNEVELLNRLLTNEREVWGDFDRERIEQAVHVNDCELAPHTLEGVAMYEVVSRMIEANDDDELDHTERAIVYDTGSLEITYYDDGSVTGESDEYTIEDIDYDLNDEGRHGIPCTYARDVIADMIAENDVILPQDAIETMQERLNETSMFENNNVDNLGEKLDEVHSYVLSKQYKDVLSAIMSGKKPDTEEIEEYIEHVYCWGTDDDSIDPDPLKMKVFETNHLGFDNDDYDGVEPGDIVEEHRQKEIIQAVSSWVYDHAESDFTVDMDEFPVEDVPAIDELLGRDTFKDVHRVYPDFDPTLWDDASEGTETYEVREKAVDKMQELYGYSDESARRTAAYVVEETLDVAVVL